MRAFLLSLAILLNSFPSFILSTEAVFAQGGPNLPSAAGAIGEVGNGLIESVEEGEDIGSIVLFSMKSVRRLVNIVALAVVVITGFLLVTSQEEGQLAKSRNTLIATVAAMVLINVAGPVYNALNQGFVGQNTITPVGGGAGAALLTSEILGFIDFIEEPLLVVAILMIIISGIRAIISFGSEQGLTQIKRTILSTLAGIVILGAKFALTEAMAGNVGSVDPMNISSEGIMRTIVSITMTIVSFMALAAVTVIIIAGITMVLNKGDQETATKARNLILRVVIGLVVILVSFAIVMVFAQMAT